MKIETDKLLKILNKLEKKHRKLARDSYSKNYTEKNYENGFADGIQEAKNQIVGLLDKKRN
ncbi:MAG: hypothetical protein ACOCP8_06245 [archaeon]